MNRYTRRRLLLAGGAVAGVGGVSYLLTRERESGSRYLRAAGDVSASRTFAYVAGATDSGGETLALDVAVRRPADEDRTVELLAGTDHARDLWFPALRSLWRFEVDLAGVPAGTYDLRLGDATLPVELLDRVPSGANPVGGERFLPKGAWRSATVAYASGFLSRPAEGTLVVAFRAPAGSDRVPLDALALRDPDGAVRDRWTVRPGTLNARLPLDAALDPLRYVTLVSRADGETVDTLRLDHFG